jgi:hypothetical protein
MPDSNSSRPTNRALVATLEAYYCAPTFLTLGKLRAALEGLAQVSRGHPGRAPTVAELASVLLPLELGELSLQAVANIVEVVRPMEGEDVLAAFTLKQLEELLVRVERAGAA